MSARAEIRYSEQTPKLLSDFTYRFGKPETIYYPFCKYDGSLSLFSSTVIYADTDPVLVELLKRTGFKAYHADPRTFKPDVPIDLLLLLQTPLDAREIRSLIQLVAPRYVVCDSYEDVVTHVGSVDHLGKRGMIGTNHHVFSQRA